MRFSEVLAMAVQQGGGASYSQEATALFARMSVQPTATRKGVINTFIIALQSSGIWTKTDTLHVWAAHDQQASLLEWKGSGYDAAVVGTPTFTADVGWKHPSIGDYLTAAYAPGTLSLGMTATNCHLGAFVNNDVTGANSDFSLGGSATYRVRSRDNVGPACCIAGTGFIPVPDTPAPPYHISASRTSTTSAFGYNNGVAGAEFTTLSNTALPTTGMVFLTSAAGVAGSGRTQRVAHCGQALTAQQHLDFSTAIAAYLAGL